MKGIKFRFLAIAIVMALVVGLMAGCSSSSTSASEKSSAPDNSNAPKAEQSIQDQAKELIKTPNIRVVIGSTSTGGDTYQVSNMVAQKLGEVLGKNIKVDAIGASNGFDTIKRISDGSTIMIFHDMAYLGYLYGKEGYTDILSDYQVGPTVAINPGNAFSVPKNSKFNTVGDVIEAAGNGEQIKVAIQPGGVSEIGYSAMKNAIRIQYPGKEGNLIAVNTGSQADKNQLLFDGQADLINSSVQANEQYNHLPADDQKAMKFIWLTAKKATIEQANESGFGQTSRDELLKYVEPNATVTEDGTKNFTFDKEFFVLFNKDMDPKIVDLYDKALAEAFKDPALIKQLKDSFFIPNYKNVADANVYLKDKISAYDKIIKAIQ